MIQPRSLTLVIAVALGLAACSSDRPTVTPVAAESTSLPETSAVVSADTEILVGVAADKSTTESTAESSLGSDDTAVDPDFLNMGMRGLFRVEANTPESIAAGVCLKKGVPEVAASDFSDEAPNPKVIRTLIGCVPAQMGVVFSQIVDVGDDETDEQKKCFGDEFVKRSGSQSDEVLFVAMDIGEPSPEIEANLKTEVTDILKTCKFSDAFVKNLLEPQN
jgi:hypothetical protein